MQLFIFGKKHLRHDVSRLVKSAENTGFLHVFPNKGGICISFNVRDTVLTFISCHLAAHEGNSKCKLRNMSTEEILGGIKTVFKDFDPSLTSHYTFFMGDMNYRITYEDVDNSIMDQKEEIPQVIGGEEEPEDDQIGESSPTLERYD